MQISRIALGLVLIMLVSSILPPSTLGQETVTLLLHDESRPDSIRIEAIKEYYKNQTYAAPEAVLKLTFLHERLASKTHNQQEISQALNERSYAYFVTGDVKNAMQCLKQSIVILEKLDDQVKLVTLYVNLANLLSAEGQYQDAIKYYHKSLDLFRKTGKWEHEALTLNNIGIQLLNLEGYDLALNHFQEALAIYKSNGKMDATGPPLAGISLVYYHQNKLDLAISNGKESVILLEKENNQSTKSDAFFVLAKTYLKKGDKDNAKLYLDKSLQISRDLTNQVSILERLIFDAELSLEDDVNTSAQKAEALLSQLTEEISPSVKSDLYKLLYNCYKGQGKQEKSLGMFEKHKIYADSAASQKLKLDIMRQVIEKQYEDKLLKKEIESKEVQSKIMDKHRNKLIGILILSLTLIGGLLYYSRTKITKEKQKTEELLNELKTLKKQAAIVGGVDNKGDLNKEKLETAIDKKINETDWNVLNILLDDPVISNKDLADRAYMSIDGIGSSLRRMYDYFDIPNSKYMKIALLLKAIKISNHGNL